MMNTFSSLNSMPVIHCSNQELMSRVFRTKDAVEEATRGLLLAYPDIIGGSYEYGFIYAKQPHPKRIVSLISGGGSGHEPMHVGFVGQGLLDAACAGKIFVSAHNKQMTAAGIKVQNTGGILFIVKNYTGDVINFSVAAERLQAAGIDARCLIVADDIASADKAVGGRGTAAAVIVEKILGGAADQGLTLDQLQRLGEDVVANSRTISAATRGPSLPADDHHTAVFEVSSGTAEYGLGIHGERGTTRVDFDDIDRLVHRMLGDLMIHPAVESDVGSQDSVSSPDIPKPDNPANYLLFVNGLGNCTELELFGIYSIAAQWMYQRNYKIGANLVGSLCTALDCRGFSISVVKLKPHWLKYWHAPTDAPRFPRLSPPRAGSSLIETVLPRRRTESETASSIVMSSALLETYPSNLLCRLASLFQMYREGLDNLDRLSGDGDFGSTIAGGVTQAAQVFVEKGIPPDTTSEITILGQLFCNNVGGSAGALLGLLFDNIAMCLSVDGQQGWQEGLSQGISAVQRVGKANPGDCTMLDALFPACEALLKGESSGGSKFREATIQAMIGLMNTKSMRAVRGRACYLGERTIGYPDPGAAGVCIFLAVVAENVFKCHMEDLWEDFNNLMAEVPDAETGPD